MRRGMIAVALVAACCALMGTHVILRRLSFIGDGLAHASFGGLAIGFLCKINLFASAAVAALLTAIGIGSVSRKADISLDTSIGILFSGVFALGIVLMSHAREYRGDLFDLLLGNVLTVSQQDLSITFISGTVVIACLLLFYKEFLFSTFDSSGAAASGIPVDKLDFVLLSLLALTITTSIQTVGVILVSALLVTPAASAMQLTNRFPTMMALSTFLGVLSGVIGIYASYYFDVPAGAAIVLASTGTFFLCLLFSPKRGPIKIPDTKEEPPGPEVMGDFHQIG